MLVINKKCVVPEIIQVRTLPHRMSLEISELIDYFCIIHAVFMLVSMKCTKGYQISVIEVVHGKKPFRIALYLLVKQKENLTLHQVSHSGLFHAPLQFIITHQ